MKSVGIRLVSLLLTLNKFEPIEASRTLSKALQKNFGVFSYSVQRASPCKGELISLLKLISTVLLFVQNIDLHLRIFC